LVGEHQCQLPDFGGCAFRFILRYRRASNVQGCWGLVAGQEWLRLV
jgi:hypothetical protein